MTSAGTVASGTSGSGPPLVLAHGWPWSSFSWHRVIPQLADQYTVYWYDMPGYGRSDKRVDQATSLDVQGVIFREMLDHWQLDAPFVVAHDFGGATTLRAHLLHGVEFSAYLAMNIVAMRPWGSSFFEHVGQHIDAFLGNPHHIHAAIAEAYIRGALVNDIAERDMEGLIEPWLSEEGRISFYRQFAQADEKYTEEIEGFFSDIRCPTTILWGKDDPWIPIARGRAFQQRVGTDQFHELIGVGHLPQLEAPNAVVGKIFEAFKRQL
ncbi:MAG: alpha/beta hydrolase [Pseudomonadota bacterium]